MQVKLCPTFTINWNKYCIYCHLSTYRPRSIPKPGLKITLYMTCFKILIVKLKCTKCLHRKEHYWLENIPDSTRNKMFVPLTIMRLYPQLLQIRINGILMTPMAKLGRCKKVKRLISLFLHANHLNHTAKWDPIELKNIMKGQRLRILRELWQAESTVQIVCTDD